MIVAISISPSGADETGGVSEAVADAVQVIRDSGLPNETNAMFTNIEGEWDEVMAVVKQAVFRVAESSPRVGLVLKADLRQGVDTGRLARKVERVEEALRDAGGYLLGVSRWRRRAAARATRRRRRARCPWAPWR